MNVQVVQLFLALIGLHAVMFALLAWGEWRRRSALATYRHQHVRRLGISVRRGVLMIRPSAVIDRTFRSLEMLLVTALIGVGAKLVSDDASAQWMALLSVAVGYYWLAPIAPWLAEFDPKVPDAPRFYGLLIAPLALLFALVAQGFLAMAVATIQFEPGPARIGLERWYYDLNLNVCAQIRGGQSCRELALLRYKIRLLAIPDLRTPSTK